ncbi:response regulator transcription factor [Arcobacteraceae bacterium]|nr:response regulator transcription factor [Arcobacteraceae bacterium]
MKKKILLLEDDTLLGETLQELLTSQNYDITLATTGNDAIDYSYDNKYDLYIFDINVPDITGLELLESLRDASDTTPTIFISALVDLESISKAFEVGAYDYIKKPFFPEELLIRVNAKLQESRANILFKNLEYSPNDKILKKDDIIIPLGEVQQRLFSEFIHNIGKVVSKEILFESLDKPTDTALRVAINKLKQTIGTDIKNIRGVGYILE